MKKPVLSLFYPVALGLSFWVSGNAVYAEEEATAPGLSESDLRPAIQIQKRSEGKLFAMPGVVGVGVGVVAGTARPALHVYLNTSAAGASAAVLPLSLEGLPVEVFETDEIKALDGPPGNNHRLAYAIPVPMGVSTGNVSGNFAGTLGYRVFRTGQSSNVGYVTNNHVGGASGANLCPAQLNPANLPPFGLDQCQPGLLDAGGACVPPPIGDLVQAIPLIMGAQFQNVVDAVFVQSTRALVDKFILDIGNPSPSLQNPTVGLAVQKSGRTTGFTTGSVQTLNTTVNVNYGTGCGIARFIGQIGITPGTFSAGGDSGSPVLGSLDSAGRRRPVGLLFAGSSTTTFANRISDVLGALHTVIDTL